MCGKPYRAAGGGGGAAGPPPIVGGVVTARVRAGTRGGATGAARQALVGGGAPAAVLSDAATDDATTHTDTHELVAAQIQARINILKTRRRGACCTCMSSTSSNSCLQCQGLSLQCQRSHLMHGQEPQAAEQQAARDCLLWTWKSAWLLWQNVVTKQKGVCCYVMVQFHHTHTQQCLSYACIQRSLTGVVAVG